MYTVEDDPLFHGIRIDGTNTKKSKRFPIFIFFTSTDYNRIRVDRWGRRYSKEIPNCRTVTCEYMKISDMYKKFKT